MEVGGHSGAVTHSRDVIGQFYQAGMTHSITTFQLDDSRGLNRLVAFGSISY